METEAFIDALNLNQRQKKIYLSKICQNSLQKREVWRIPLRLVEFHLPLAQSLPDSMSQLRRSARSVELLMKTASAMCKRLGKLVQIIEFSCLRYLCYLLFNFLSVPRYNAC
jgi:hypothetical protein